MSWIQKLYETYNNCQSVVGYSSDEGARPLLPICHIGAQAHIEIVIDKEGNFRRARIITDQKNDATTIIPCTEGSASRSGRKPESHPLCDKLQYVAGDFTKYGCAVTSGFRYDPEEPYRNYVEVLTRWCESEFSHPKAHAILKYIKKKKVIEDLVEQQKLFIGTNGKILAKGEARKEKNLGIFSVINTQDDAFVRWIVESPESLETKVWKDKTLWDSWIGYYLSTKKKESLCLATGKEAVLSDNHPKYIRVRGDGAKLISSNDNRGFTFMGRFQTGQQAFSISLEVSQKAHYALMWLIDRQGKVFFRKGDDGRKDPALTIVAWVSSDIKVLQPMDDPFDILGINELPSDLNVSPFTAQEVARKLRNKILGYNADLHNVNSIQIMSMDSASKGRLAVTYYQEQDITDYLDRINKWHVECAWIHRYRYKDIPVNDSGRNKRQFYTFVGAPAPIDIAEAAYGQKADDKLKYATVSRILPCIIEGIQVPRDLVDSAVRRASNRIGMEKWEWNKTLSIACALFRKYNRKENYDMTLDLNRKTRDYLYGRLLALAESLEEWALTKTGEKRESNAARLMQRFSEHPFSTWRTIELALAPYKARLGGKSKKRQRMIDEVIASFNDDDFLNDKRLSGEFLLGYHCQREALKPNGKPDENDPEEDAVE
jgi:CRISPR-associated protein Csd1